MKTKCSEEKMDTFIRIIIIIFSKCFSLMEKIQFETSFGYKNCYYPRAGICLGTHEPVFQEVLWSIWGSYQTI